MTIFSAWGAWRTRLQASPAAPQQPTMRQVLNALEVGESVQWLPALDAGAGLGSKRRSHRSFYVAAVVLVLTASCAWLVATYPVARLESGVLAPMPSQRLEQIAESTRPPLVRVADPIISELSPALVVTDAIAVEAGRRTRLSAHIANGDKVQPETVVLIRGLPGDIRLTDGIMIDPGLWMLRADLLASVEFEVAAGARGRYTLELELRTSGGAMLSSSQTVLAIAPARKDVIRPPNAIARGAEEEMGGKLPPVSPRSPAQTGMGVVLVKPTAAPVRKRVVKKARRPIPAMREPAAVAAKAKAESKVRVAKPARRTSPSLRSQVTVLSAKPRPRPPIDQSRLVWPGDDPRSASYSRSSPAFLGGVLPGVAPQSPATAGDGLWRRRVFGHQQ